MIYHSNNRRIFQRLIIFDREKFGKRQISPSRNKIQTFFLHHLQNTSHIIINIAPVCLTLYIGFSKQDKQTRSTKKGLGRDQRIDAKHST